ncbi:hypothetical protein ACFWR9_16540 [Streptomyces sp. NPDC058534]|uniref:hypothetical protein n=1 Tax=Streptomyces sp. NPDC058534 TaxID=3346541 RepID=UPI00364BC41E
MATTVHAWMSVSRPVMDTAVITMIVGLLGSTNAFAGWLTHLGIALLAGTGFGVLLGGFARKAAPAVVLGLAYGAVWWCSARCGSCPRTWACRSSSGIPSPPPASAPTWCSGCSPAWPSHASPR